MQEEAKKCDKMWDILGEIGYFKITKQMEIKYK
jgi:hypothetical protein